MKQKKLISAVILLAGGASRMYADTTWLDTPFHDMMARAIKIMNYFLVQTKFIAGIILLVSLVMCAIRMATTGKGVKDEIVKTLTAIILYVIVSTNYIPMLQGINKIIYSWSYASTYNTAVDTMLKTMENNSGFWADRAAQNGDMFNDIIKQKKDDNNVTTYYIDLQMAGSGYLSPNACMRIILLVVEQIQYKMDHMARSAYPFTWVPKDLGQWLLMGISMIWVVFCGCCAAIQYFCTALEFPIIMGVGVIFLPGMIWNGTKFLTEKLVGAFLGFFIKFLFVTIGFMLSMSGFLDMAMRSYSGTIDMFVYTIFVTLFYAMITMNGPKLAQTLLTGQPQMSMGEWMQAAGAAMFGANAAKNVAKTFGSTGADFVRNRIHEKNEQYAAKQGGINSAEKNLQKNVTQGIDTSTKEGRKQAADKWAEYKKTHKNEIKEQTKQSGIAAQEQVKEMQKENYRKNGGVFGSASRLVGHTIGAVAHPLQTLKSGRVYHGPKDSIDVNRIGSLNAANLIGHADDDPPHTNPPTGPVPHVVSEDKGIGPQPPIPFARSTEVEGPALPFGPQTKGIQEQLDGNGQTQLQRNYKNATDGAGPVPHAVSEDKGIGPQPPIPFARNTEVEGPALPFGPQILEDRE